jgi:hypothetical protein
MKNRVVVLSLFLGAFVATSVSPSQAIAHAAPEKVKWEYKVLTTSQLEALGGDKEGPSSLTAGLNKLGEDGWELVGIEPGHVPPPVKLPKYVFKRAK